MLERPECTGPFLPLFLRAPRTPLGHHNQLAQGPREHSLIYMTIIFGWLPVRCARDACAARGTRLHPLIHFRNGPFLGVAGWKFWFLPAEQSEAPDEARGTGPTGAMFSAGTRPLWHHRCQRRLFLPASCLCLVGNTPIDQSLILEYQFTASGNRNITLHWHCQ